MKRFDYLPTGNQGFGNPPRLEVFSPEVGQKLEC